jgi:hypothetical protein
MATPADREQDKASSSASSKAAPTDDNREPKREASIAEVLRPPGFEVEPADAVVATLKKSRRTRASLLRLHWGGRYLVGAAITQRLKLPPYEATGIPRGTLRRSHQECRWRSC